MPLDGLSSQPAACMHAVVGVRRPAGSPPQLLTVLSRSYTATCMAQCATLASAALTGGGVQVRGGVRHGAAAAQGVGAGGAPRGCDLDRPHRGPRRVRLRVRHLDLRCTRQPQGLCTCAVPFVPLGYPGGYHGEDVWRHRWRMCQPARRRRASGCAPPSSQAMAAGAGFMHASVLDRRNVDRRNIAKVQPRSGDARRCRVV